MRDLKVYRHKRDSGATPEPMGEERDRPGVAPGAPRLFVVQQHAARRMHWDLRLEIEGVLASWAVPKGPTLDPAERRLAVRTEDHPIEYLDFEGVIPEGNYGAGPMIVWDQGVYRTWKGEPPAAGLSAGKLDLVLEGHKLRGRFALVRTRGAEGKEWLLLRKGPAPEGVAELVDEQPASVLSGLTVDEVREGRTRHEEVEELLRDAGSPSVALAESALRPMLAATGDGAFSRPGWLFELKYDGVRVIAEKRGDEVRLLARTGGDRSEVYPEITYAVSQLPIERCVVDGEIVALDESGRTSFERLQRRFTQRDPALIERGRAEVPIVYYAFDLLSVQGRDVRALPLVERKALLARFAPRSGIIRFADHVEGDGERLFEAAAAHDMEGVVAKRADSPYSSGRRSRHWLKLKVPRQAHLVVVGLANGKGSRRALGSLAGAWWRGGELVWAGNVGSGLREVDVQDLLGWADGNEVEAPPLAGVPDPPPAGVRWVRPTRTFRVRFTEVTSSGFLRHPVFLGMTPEVAAEDCLGPAERAPERELAAAAPAPHEAELQITRPTKIFWPVEGYTKGDLLGYYEAVWPWIAPYLRDRPVVLTRYPDGIDGKSFYQKNAPDWTPAWATHERIDDTDYFVCEDLRTLLYVINSGAIPLHVWSARLESLDRPDWTILDLDPKDAPFARVVEIARHLHRLLDDLGAPHFVKTSGQDGLHILVPLGGALNHAQARLLAEVLARIVCADLPGIATITRPVAARGDKVYVDYLQNGYGKLIASPLCVRPRPGAPVSMPLRWSQVTARLDPARFSIRTAPRLLGKGGDPNAPLLSERADVASLLEELPALLEQRGG
jgi:bifunctional non-homologous end joining protein LigD